MDPPIGRLDLVALDCPDARGLAVFYRSLVGGEIGNALSDSWIELATPNGRLAFQQIDGYRPPTWPTGDVPQQAHVDIDVDDLDAAAMRAVELGATKAPAQPNPEQFQVFLDPAGHPFCLVDARYS